MQPRSKATSTGVLAELEALLGAVARIEDDLTPCLRAWETALPTHAGASHLLTFVRDNYGRAGREYRPAEAVTDEATADVLLELLVSL